MRFRSRTLRTGSNSRRIQNILGDKYEIGHELGRGMNAITFRVKKVEKSNMPLVAKVLLTPEDEPRITSSSFRRHVERFIKEMRNLERLQNSKFIVPVYAFHANELQPFFVMKYCETSLEQEMENRILSMQKILDVLLDICQGLTECHSNDIIHRDLKPANILKYEGRWVLADFGMSLLGNEGSVVTVPESLPGTIPYTAPEVMYYQPDRIGPQADIFSLGVTIKEMLTGTNVWENSPSSLIRGADRHKRHQIHLFDAFIEKMMNLRPEERPKDMDVVVKELHQIFEEYNKSGVESLDGIKKFLSIDS